MIEEVVLYLYVYAFGETGRTVLRVPCSTGEVAGAKTSSGDKKTPEGIYFFTKEHLKRDLAPIYGSRAFPMDYPNLMDRIAERDGNSIWMHGTNKPLKPMDSNGCVALFDQFVKTADQEVFAGSRKLFLSERNHGLKIVGDDYQVFPKAFKKKTESSDPLVTAGLAI